MAEKQKVGVRANALAMRRGQRLLFENLSFAAKPGDYVEIRGANGAGKTSLLRALAGFFSPTAGRVDFDALEEPALCLHYVGHLNGLKPGASVRAHFRYWAGLFAGAASVDDVAIKLGVGPLLDLPTRVLSQGQQRRVALARLLIAPRPVWLLDEPAAALDSVGRGIVAELITTHCANGGIALAAVHEPLGPAPAQTITVGA